MNKFEEKVEDFCEEIKNKEVYQDFEQARTDLEENKEAQELLEDFKEERRLLDIYREGDFSEVKKQKEKVEKLAEEVRNNEIVSTYLDTKNKFRQFIGKTAQKISEEIDFPLQLPKKGGGCGC